MANRRRSQMSNSGSSESDDSDYYLSESDTSQPLGGSCVGINPETRSLASCGLSKRDQPLKSPLLEDVHEPSELLGDDLGDALTSQDLESLREVLRIPSECDLKVPGPKHNCHDPPPGYFTIFLEHFTNGLVFPPQTLLVNLVDSFGISFSQLSPNALIVFTAFCHKVKGIQMPPSVELFHSLFSGCRSKPDSFIYFQPRPKCKFLSRIPSPKSFWKSQFFYAKDCGWGIPAVWSSGLRKIAMTETHHALQLQCRDLGLFEEFFNIGSLNSAGNKFDLAGIRARKAVVGRRSPIAGNSRAPTSRAALESREIIRRGFPRSRSEHYRGPESNAPKKNNFSPSNRVLEAQPSNGGKEDKKRGHEVAQKKDAEEISKNVKRVRADDQGTSSKTPRAKHIFVDGVNHKEKADSFWDLEDPKIGWKKGRSIVGDHDMVHLVSLPTDSFAHSLAWNSCQGLSLACAVRVREEKLRNDQDKWREEVSRVKEENCRLIEEKNKISAELLQVQRKLADKVKDLAILEEKHSAELKTGGQFLESEAGKTFLKNVEEKSVRTFKASDAFRDDVLDQAMTIHDDVVLDCRDQLRKTGHVPEEVVMMIEPSVLEISRISIDDIPLGDAEMIEALDLQAAEEET
ncbi:uncharacterized protein [Primulina eburnea]|uniref:uncharacterized protein n=1 Tax=Primulina eburnea TaxID=1245227 RepID=UPI003C6C66A6